MRIRKKKVLQPASPVLPSYSGRVSKAWMACWKSSRMNYPRCHPLSLLRCIQKLELWITEDRKTTYTHQEEERRVYDRIYFLLAAIMACTKKRFQLSNRELRIWWGWTPADWVYDEALAQQEGSMGEGSARDMYEMKNEAMRSYGSGSDAAV